jgi:hypothetical protein
MKMEPWLSPNNSMGDHKGNPISINKLRIQAHCREQLLIDMYSASVDDRATIFWVWEVQVTTPSASFKKKPLRGCCYGLPCTIHFFLCVHLFSFSLLFPFPFLYFSM